MTAPVATSRRMGLRRRLVVLFAIAGIALLLVVVVLASSLIQLQHRRDAAVDRYDPASLAVGDLRTAMLDQETGVRGYVLSGDQAFLEPYENGGQTGDAALAELDRLLAGSPLAEQELTAARTAVDDWRTGYAARAVLGTVPGGSRQTAYLQESRAAFDQVRGAIDDLDDAISAERADALDEWRSAFRTVVAVGIVSVVGLVVVGVVIFIGLRKSVTDPIEDLAGEVRTVAGGDLRTSVEGTGPPEIVALGGDIEAMRQRILEELAKVEEAHTAIAAQAIELERSNADLEQFAYVASHDLQEPLRKIAGFCQLLERRYKGQLDEKADQYIEFVVDGAKRMQDLINDLLAFSRVGRTTDRFVPVKLGAAVDAGLANLGTVPDEQGATIDVGDLPTVDGDPRLLTALFQNLIGNALKFRGEADPVIRVRGDVDGDVCRLTVADNGIGIEPEYGEQIFTLFQRLHNKSQYEGTGIGLALCKRIAEFHGGSIRLVTDGGSPGATFEVVLPLRSVSASPDGAIVGPATGLPGSDPDAVPNAAGTVEPPPPAPDAAPSPTAPSPAVPPHETPDDEVLRP